MKRLAALILFLLFVFNSYSQTIFSCVLVDAGDKGPLANVSILTNGGEPVTATDNNGKGKLIVAPGKNRFTFSAVGYTPQTLAVEISPAIKDSLFTIMLEKEVKELDQVIVFSSRTNSRIENTPTRVEVPGAEEVEEECGIKP